MTPTTVELGLAIRDLRRRQDLSQEQLSERCGLHRSYVGGVERGERNPTWLTLSQIADGLDVRLSTVIARAEDLVGARPAA